MIGPSPDSRLGAVPDAAGTRFAVWSGAAERMWVCLFDGAQEAAPSSCGCAGGSAANDEAELEAITRAVLERLKGIR